MVPVDGWIELLQLTNGDSRSVGENPVEVPVFDRVGPSRGMGTTVFCDVVFGSRGGLARNTNVNANPQGVPIDVRISCV